MYNFDKIVPRENTACFKYDRRSDYFDHPDLLPMWVADMDFETPDFIREAVIKRARHPVYGYTFRSAAYYQSIIHWLKNRWHWEVEKDWIVFSPGIVPALNFAVQAFTKPGDGVIVQPPVYFPFFEAVNSNGRKLIQNQLLYNDGRYEIDFQDLEAKAKDAEMILLCSPHNPVGRCWQKDELLKLGEICLKYDIIILSDEIHGDLIMPGYRHLPLASLSPDIADKTVTCVAPSKTFNLAGLSTSSVLISNEDLRKSFQKMLDTPHISFGNLFGAVASQAGYEHGDLWLDELMQYVSENFHYLKTALSEEFEQIQAVQLEATYLAWLDFTKTGLDDDTIRETLIKKCELGLSHGPIFGAGGSGFQRINLAAPRTLVEKAVERLKHGFG